MFLFRAHQMRPGRYYRCHRGINAGGARLCSIDDIVSMNSFGQIRNHTTGVTFRISDVPPGIAARFRAYLTDAPKEGGDAAR